MNLLQRHPVALQRAEHDPAAFRTEIASDMVMRAHVSDSCAVNSRFRPKVTPAVFNCSGRCVRQQAIHFRPRQQKLRRLPSELTGIQTKNTARGLFRDRPLKSRDILLRIPEGRPRSCPPHP